MGMTHNVKVLHFNETEIASKTCSRKDVKAKQVKTISNTYKKFWILIVFRCVASLLVTLSLTD